ncbi:phage capsid protein [Serratia marcescens]|uniref:phage capsid protein n=1 Tax=Serratia marcescens TaxID=615 RepID=UPI00074542A3|nr:phage capsid protein [Serratia marcescens]CVB31447.1 Bacteriophage%2C scaffolding protein [Serratia marcescens]CVB84711.1 Bacteriophage%2C scaffolding protein [Serratia marcescens]CVF86616.1 Bacteriophage%2C scaffolding protein [Serratia marcescens]CVG58539.1 Bacteriophage%2C scaffolding protein [Serratia marcescens]
MESELIIDGQVIDLSEKQEEAEEVVTEAKENPDEKSQEEPEQKEKKAESEQPEEQPEDYSLQIGDEEISLNPEEDDHIDGQPAPQWVKELRKGFKETQKENRELRRQLEQIQSKPAEVQQPQSDVIPPKPTLESCEYDEAAFEQAMTDWHEKKGRAEQVKQQQQRQHHELQQRLTERLTKHQERAAKLPVKDYREMEDIVRQEIPVIQQEILIHAADEGSELVAYALGKNQQLRQRVAAETDPIRAAFLLGQISQQVKLAPKPKKAIKPEPEVRGGGADAKQDDFNKLCPGAKIE